MKIIIFTFLLTIQAQYFNEEFSTFLSTIDFISNEINQINNNDKTTNEIYENETSSFSYIQSITIQNQFIDKDQWINLENISEIFWKKINNHSTYILKSDGKCLKKMCYIKLKYNHLLLNKNDGCLSFILWTYGQPVGQLWIEEDDQQETFSQKIQLTNSSLRIQHSFKSNIKNLSIDGRILFENAQIDTITLSDLNINFNGSCPIYSSIINSTLSEDIFQKTSYLDQTTIIIENTFKNDNITEDYILIESSTIQLNQTLSYKLLNQKKFFLLLFLIILFCFLIIFSSIFYGIWTIQKHYRFIWYIPYNHPIQFLSRTSISSSTRSNIQIKTFEQLSNDIFLDHFHEEYFNQFLTNRNSQLHSYF